MLIFRNPGLIDLEAVRTLGISVKKPGSFGRFGTGLKFSLASILRGGGAITICRGMEEHEVSTIKKTVSETEFDIVTIDGEPMGITTQLGKDWEPWMVLRELACNAMDEGGEFGFLDPAAIEGNTTIRVTWDDLNMAFKQKDDLFLDTKRERLHSTAELEIFSGPSAHLYYRGVRVFKLESPSQFAYNLLEEQKLTEDRTLGHSYTAARIIRNALAILPSKELARQAITANSNYFEVKLDFMDLGWGVKPSREFLDAAIDARESKKLTSESAKKLLLKYMRSSEETESRVGGSYRRVVDDAFQYAIDLLKGLGMTFPENQTFLIVEELPNADMLSMLEDGRIYYVRKLSKMSGRDIAEELVLRWAEINCKGYELQDMAKLLAPIIIGKSKDLQEDEQLVREDGYNERKDAVEESPKFLLIGEWSGYRAEQRKEVYCEVVDASLADKMGDFEMYRWTDNTTMEITKMPYDGRPVKLQTSYGPLVRKAVKTGNWDANNPDPTDEVVIDPTPDSQPISIPVGSDDVPF